MAESSVFHHIDRRRVETTAGFCDLPISYEAGSMVALVYRIGVQEASRMLANVGLVPMVLGNHALAVVCIFDYRETSIGPYRELGIGIQARRLGSKPTWFATLRSGAATSDQGLFVLSLPVTTEQACSAGRELWGYPKYVTPMECDFSTTGLHVQLGNECEITMGKSGGLRFSAIPLVTYSQHRGRLLRTVVEQHHSLTLGGHRSVRMTCDYPGPTSMIFNTLKLPHKQPIAAIRTDTFRALLPAGIDMGRDVCSSDLHQP
jgi:hypothetical protein